MLIKVFYRKNWSLVSLTLSGLPAWAMESEGLVAHAIVETRAELNLDGTGVSAYVLADSVEALNALQASGEYHQL